MTDHDARTVRPGHAVTYHGDPAPRLASRARQLADILREVAADILARSEKRMADAASAVPGAQQWQLRGAGLALKDVADALYEVVDKL